MALKRLVMALDFAKARKNPPPHTRTAKLGADGVWRLCVSGNGYSNTYELSELSEQEIAFLKTIEVEDVRLDL